MKFACWRRPSARVLTAFWLAACAPSQHGVTLAGATRWVAGPSHIAVLSQEPAAPGVPSQVTFGGAHGRSALFLRFPSQLLAHAPLKAFIVLAPYEGAAIDGTKVTIEAWHISSAWQPEQLAVWSDKPALAPPYARAALGSSSPLEQRIDVSELIEFAVRNPDLDFGIALLGRGGSGHGASFATGMAGGAAPRLEVYVR